MMKKYSSSRWDVADKYMQRHKTAFAAMRFSSTSIGNAFWTEWSSCNYTLFSVVAYMYMCLDVTWEEYVEHCLLGDTITAEESRTDGPQQMAMKRCMYL